MTSVQAWRTGRMTSASNIVPSQHCCAALRQGPYTHQGLFAILDAGRFDFFSRGINEAGREYEESALFQKFKGDSIKSGALHKRRVLQLDNPRIAPETPLSRGKLWFPPASDK